MLTKSEIESGFIDAEMVKEEERIMSLQESDPEIIAIRMQIAEAMFS